MNFEFGTGPMDEPLMSSQPVLLALKQRLTVLLQKGIVTREQVAARFRDFLPSDIAGR